MGADIEDHLDDVIDAGEHVVTVVTTRVAWMGTRDEALEAAGLSAG